MTTLRSVPFSDSARSIECGDGWVCAVLESDKVECWDSRETALIVLTLAEHGASSPVQVATGTLNACVLGSFGDVRCFGANDWGNLVSGTTDAQAGDLPASQPWPAALIGAPVNDISVNGYVTCARHTNATVKCWGFPQYGVLGQPSLASVGNPLGDELGETGLSLPPIDLGSNLSVQQLSAGSTFVCALLSNRRIKCWGNNAEGQLGLGHSNDIGDDNGEMGDALANTLVD
jgi:hypothetical protein